MKSNNRYLLMGFVLLALNYLSVIGQAEEIALTNLDVGKVILPWTELKKLLEELETLKKHNTADKKTVKPLPINYSIIQSYFNGEVKGNSVHFEAELVVQIFKTGWVTIPLFSKDVGIEAVNITVIHSEKNQATVTPVIANDVQPNINQLIRDTNGYHLFATGPQQLAIQVVFYLPIQVKESIYTFTFIPPRAVVNHFFLQIAEKGVTLVQLPPYSRINQPENMTTVETVLSEHDNFQLSWQIKTDSGITRKSLATIRTLASIDKAELVVINTIIIKYLTSLEQIAFHLPVDVEILNVTSLDITQWSTEKLVQSQVIKIAGHQDLPPQIKIEISYRRRLNDLPLETNIPTIALTGVDNLEGFLGIEVLGNLEVTTKKVTKGVLIPAKNLPPTLWQKTANPLLYGYQFHTSTFNATISIKGYQEIQTVVANIDHVDCVTHRTLEGKSINRILYSIRNNDRQFLSLTLPENSHLWQAFLDGTPVKPAQKDNGEILIPMKKSLTQGETLQSFTIEIGYITAVNKLSLKGDILNQLPAVDIPISYLQWRLYLPEYYEYSKFEGPLKQVTQFSIPEETSVNSTQIDIPTQGQLFLFEKYLIVNEKPYMRGKYGQFLGDDILLSVHTSSIEKVESKLPTTFRGIRGDRQQVIPNRAIDSGN
ncbi:MAG: hypothetical protein HC877_02195 [Thioploca sp.]|nr:hypothetical protein [Thioploca sp.]